MITRGLANLHPRGAPRALDVATYYMASEAFFSIIHVATLIPGCGYFRLQGPDCQDLCRDYISCGPNGFRRRFSKFFPCYKSMGTYLMKLYMKFHHIWLTDISDIQMYFFQNANGC